MPNHADVRVSFVAADDADQHGSLGELWNVRFEEVVPVRKFGSFRAQRNFQGSWWLATTGEHVGFESWLERDHVMLLDFDPRVVGLSSQPFWLSWQVDGKTRRHVPDYFARLADGTAVVIDVRPDERIGPEDAAVFAATSDACASVGWEYRRVGVVDPVLAANVRWLAGYRHLRCLKPEVAVRIRHVLDAPMCLGEVVAVVGDRLAVLPTLFHLLWTGVIRADLLSAPVGWTTTVTPGLRAA